MLTCRLQKLVNVILWGKLGELFKGKGQHYFGQSSNQRLGSVMVSGENLAGKYQKYEQ